MPVHPMPKDTPNYLAALALIRAALGNGTKLTDEECRDFYQRRAGYRVQRTHTFIGEKRRGKLVYRVLGFDQWEFNEHPIAWENRERLRQFEMQVIRVFKRPLSSREGVLARKAKAQPRIYQIYALADKYANRGRHKAGLIARKLNISAKYVREVLKKRT